MPILFIISKTYIFTIYIYFNVTNGKVALQIQICSMMAKSLASSTYPSIQISSLIPISKKLMTRLIRDFIYMCLNKYSINGYVLIWQ
jgi:hypothetical protein